MPDLSIRQECANCVVCASLADNGGSELWPGRNCSQCLSTHFTLWFDLSNAALRYSDPFLLGPPARMLRRGHVSTALLSANQQPTLAQILAGI